MDIRTSPTMDKQIEKAAETMGANNTAKLEMGYVLVLDETPEAENRKRNKVFFFPKEIKGKKYLVCRE